MKLGVVALDYDGTIADHGALDPAVRAAILRARERDITVVLVTGRILDELRRVAGDLRFVDAVVAENGAVLAFPATGYSQILMTPPPPAFLAELGRRKVPAKQGQVVVEADAEHAPAILGVIQEHQLPLTLLFNRDRVMVLPQAVNKATGLRELLRMLRRSEHDAIGVGNAENDHALLEAIEIGAAVAWGSPALQAVADEIVDGDGPRAVAAYIDRLAASPLLDPERTRRHRIVLGSDYHGEELTVASGAGNLIIGGDPRSGKSWLAGLLAEQLILQRYCLCVVDPEGDYGSLASLPGVTILGGDDPPPGPRDVVRALRHPDASVVVDLSSVPHPEKHAHVASLLATLAGLRRQTGLPHRVIIDQAHDFLHEPSAHALLDLDLRGFALVTCRMSEVHSEVLAACETLITTRVTDSRQVDTVIGRYGTAPASLDWAGELADLELGDAMLFSARGADAAAVCRFRLLPRLSPHIQRRHKDPGVPIPE